jgi:hypothetical protein
MGALRYSHQKQKLYLDNGAQKAIKKPKAVQRRIFVFNIPNPEAEKSVLGGIHEESTC